jgi:hypothetical protein
MGNNTSYVPNYKESDYKKIRPGQNIYKIDKKNVYWRGSKINADGATFQNLKYNYGKDINNIFWDGKITDIPITEIESFLCLKKYYAISENYVYYKGKIIDRRKNLS